MVLPEPATACLTRPPLPPQITQMKFRLSEGRGECFYYIGRSITPYHSQFLARPCQTLVGWQYTRVHVNIHRCSPTASQAQCRTRRSQRIALIANACFCLLGSGVEDDGYPRGLNDTDLEGSMATVRLMAKTLGATAELLESFTVGRMQHWLAAAPASAASDMMQCMMHDAACQCSSPALWLQRQHQLRLTWCSARCGMPVLESFMAGPARRSNSTSCSCHGS